MRGLLLCLIFIATSALAAIEAYEFDSPEMEANFIKLTKELRCLVCQNQSLADSNAGLAKDLRRQTYEMLTQGKTPDQVVQYMVDRYGDFVLYRPRLKTSTLLLWLGPFVLLLLVLGLVIRHMRGRQKLAPPDAEAMHKAHQLLSDTQEKR
ncbi:MAG: cytochrome c-type biogenesis protein CcmH [Gammaproteobacteria bacterium]|nr:cytochrome c-type biogenesis protein CcmH [Gammaproteobacteria bacterium]MCZ6798265.1 cytochrome c-type biogenesis protein CcmH [Gammaproteobacteria bacterium]